MPRKITITVLCAAMIGIFALFAATNATAFDDVSGSPQYSVTKQGWTVTLSKIEELGGGLFAWRYTIALENTTDVKGLRNAAMLCPDCSPPSPLIKIDLNPPTSSWDDVFPAGVGDPHGFGEDNESAFVVQGESDKTSDWTLVADTNQVGTSTIRLDIHKIGGVTFEMATPACLGGAAVGASEAQECITVERGTYPISMMVYRDASGRPDIYNVKFYKTTDCTGDFHYGTIYPNPDGLVYCSGGARDPFNECIQLNASSPGCVDYYVGGTLCQFCY